MNLGEESEILEHKLSTAELSEALEAVSGMLNKHGYGTIFFGVADNGDVVGFPCGKDTENDIQRKISQKINPSPAVSTNLTRVGFKGDGIIEVRFKGNNPPYQYNGRYYVRNSRSDTLMDASELEQFILARRKNYVDWENGVGDQAISSMDEGLVRETYAKSKDIQREYPEFPGVEKTLSFFGLLTEDGKPNNACVALFGHRPIALKTATYRGYDRSEASDMDIVKGNIIQLIRIALNYCMQHTDNYYRNIGGLERANVREIPEEAMREIVVNCFAHADYSSNTSHQMFVYKDRVSVYNPGYFPLGLTPDDYAFRRLDPVERNPKIYDILHILDYVETYATGFKKIYECCEKTKTTFRYEQTEQGGFRFEVFRKGDGVIPPFGPNMGDKEKIVEVLMRDSYLDLDAIGAMIKKSKTTVKKRISELVQENRISRIGSDKTGHWVVLSKI